MQLVRKGSGPFGAYETSIQVGYAAGSSECYLVPPEVESSLSTPLTSDRAYSRVPKTSVVQLYGPWSGWSCIVSFRR